MEIKFKDLDGKELEVKELNPNHFGGMVSRQSAILDRAKTDEQINEGIDTIATTEDPAMVVDWDNWRMIREILPMKYVVMPDNNKAPLLNAHNRGKIEDVVGSAFDWKTEDSYLLSKTLISEAEPAIRQKVKEGHIDSVSIGYLTDVSKTIEIPKGKSVTVDGTEYKNDFEDNTPLVVRTWWKIKELSLVPIGADAAAKFRAELQGKNKITSEDPELQKKLDELQKEITNVKNLNQDLNIKLNERGNPMSEPIVPTPEEIRKQDRERIANLEAIASRFSNAYKGGKEALDAELKKAINSDVTVDQFRATVFNNYDESKPLDQPVTTAGMSKSDIENFSVARLLKAEVAFKSGNMRAYDEFKAGKEKEIVDAITEKANNESGISAKGLLLPAEIVSRMRAQELSKRTLTVASSASAGYLVGTDHLGGEFIGLPRNTLVAGQLGCRMISGLKGNIDVPKQLTAGTFAWGSENFASVDADLTLGQVTASPKEGKASMTYGRKLFLQSDPNVESIVVNDLNSIAKIGYDYAVINGAGGSAPTGVLNTSNVGDVVGASLDWDAILEFESDIALANLDEAALKFGGNAATRAILKGRLKSAGVSGYLMDGGTVNGYPMVVSNQFPSQTLAFGDWSKVWMLDWSMYDILVNPYKDNTGNVTIVIFVYADVQVALPAALTVANDVD
ncbi:MAG: phage major capsid protein [Chitinophagaceae bacterium]|nr:phage major capsid protein [Chitinophagaceae bacterium]